MEDNGTPVAPSRKRTAADAPDDGERTSKRARSNRKLALEDVSRVGPDGRRQLYVPAQLIGSSMCSEEEIVGAVCHHMRTGDIPVPGVRDVLSAQEVVNRMIRFEELELHLVASDTRGAMPPCLHLTDRELAYRGPRPRPQTGRVTPLWACDHPDAEVESHVTAHAPGAPCEQQHEPSAPREAGGAPRDRDSSSARSVVASTVGPADRPGWYDGAPCLGAVTFCTWYETYHVIANWFTESQRMRAKSGRSSMSPHDYVRTRAGCSAVLAEALSRYGRLDPASFREASYHRVKQCETFKTALAYLLYTRVFGATSVLDPCAGWGDRLVAALAARIRYVGVDANSRLIPLYRDIIDVLGGAAAADVAALACQVFHGDFAVCCDEVVAAAASRWGGLAEGVQPTAAAAAAPFDLVFSCPPYYTEEIYSDDPEQSTARFPGVKEWTRGFLCRSAQLAWKHLRPGGHMVFVLSDHVARRDHGYGYCEAFVLWCQARLDDCRFLGILSYRAGRMLPETGAGAGVKVSKIAQPIWVFGKGASSLPDGALTTERALALLERHYPELL